MFTMQINTDNSAFTGDDFPIPEIPMSMELGNIFNKVLFQIKMGSTEGKCIDSNGNKVGGWRLEK